MILEAVKACIFGRNRPTFVFTTRIGVVLCESKRRSRRNKQRATTRTRNFNNSVLRPSALNSVWFVSRGAKPLGAFNTPLQFCNDAFLPSSGRTYFKQYLVATRARRSAKTCIAPRLPKNGKDAQEEMTLPARVRKLRGRSRDLDPVCTVKLCLLITL